ncbi:MAG TPA: CARDB domain-containing protein [Thermoanaerobaculia bacterium]
MNPAKSLSLLAALLALGLGADPADAQQPPAFQYAAKVVCGYQKDPKELRLTRGLYATTINIHNPGREPVRFFKKLALSFPPPEQRPGKVIKIAEDSLRADEALKVDCPDLERRLFPNGFPMGYIEGFVVIESPASLDVTAVYTSAAIDDERGTVIQSSIDVEPIPERRTAQPPTGGCPDLIVQDIGPPQVDCPGGAGTCVTKVTYTIANVGPGSAGPFDTQVTMDPGGAVVVTQSVPGGLAAGNTLSLTATSPPGGNCFDPDCTICVVVDSGKAVDECKEDNNKLCNTGIG